MKAIRYFRPDMLFAITPWHLAEKCHGCGGAGGWFRKDGAERCAVCDGRMYLSACGYAPPEGWTAEVKERGPRCVECEEVVRLDAEARQKEKDGWSRVGAQLWSDKDQERR